MSKVMLPPFMGGMIANPGLFEKQVIEYLTYAGFDCTQVEKSIGYQTLWHWMDVDGENDIDFFTGNYVANQTNVPPSSFTRPLGEHFIIYGIKIMEAAVASPSIQLDWVPGAQSVLAKNSYLTIKINGVDRTTRIPPSDAQENLTTIDNGTIWLNEPIIWGGQVPGAINLKGSDPAILGQTNGKFWIGLVGIGLFS